MLEPSGPTGPVTGRFLYVTRIATEDKCINDGVAVQQYAVVHCETSRRNCHYALRNDTEDCSAYCQKHGA
jgi:hypothetical protein